MAIKWISYFLDESNLEDSELLLAIVIADHSDNDGKSFPGVPTLARRLRKSLRQTQTLLHRLEEKGYVKREQSAGRGHLASFQLERVKPTAPIEQVKGEADRTLSEPEKVKSSVVKGEVQSKERVKSSVPHYINHSSLTEEEPKDAGEHTPEFGYPLSELYAAFPDLQITPAKAGMIEAAVTEDDREAWKLTIEQYVANHDPTLNRYLPDKVGNLLNVFKSKQGEIERRNGTNKQFTTNGSKPTPGATIANRWYRQNPNDESALDG